MSLLDAVQEWRRRSGNSANGETIILQFADDHNTRAGEQWGTAAVSWIVYRGDKIITDETQMRIPNGPGKSVKYRPGKV